MSDDNLRKFPLLSYEVCCGYLTLSLSNSRTSLDPGPLSYVRIRKNAEENGGALLTREGLDRG